jgi:hypothetical protein
LSPEEPGRQHCCPHLSPDGRRLVYLSRTVGKDAYPEREVPGELRLLAVDGPGRRTLVDAARTYGWGDRAAVWRDDGELIYVGGDGRTRLLELATGGSRPLTAEPRPELGWLLDATLRHATSAAPSFSLYDPASGQVAERQPLGGCEPYFSHDGRWGYWIAGGGGPLERMELAGRRVSTLLARDDPRLPAGRRYLYFPMLSRDGRALAWGASDGEHDHFSADYDVFVVATDPWALEPRGEPVRVTADPATDRYPDVFIPRLPLGHHAGEAPLAVAFPPLDPPGEAAWDFGDGARDEAAAGRHTYERPGTYEVTARRGGERLRGRVVVEAPAPPRVVEAVLAGDGRRIEVRLDRPAAGGEPRIALESGSPVAGWRLAGDGRTLTVALDDEAAGPDRLYLAGLRAAGAAVTPMPGGWTAVQPPPWPADRRRLVFLWEAADRPNLVFDPGLGLERAFPLTPRGRARIDHRAALVVDGGAFAAPEAAAANLLAAVRRSGEWTLEAAVTARGPVAAGTPATLVWLGGESGAADLALDQEGTDLVLRLRAGPAGEPSAVRLFAVTPGRRVHVAVAWAAGRLSAYRDGRPARAGVGVAGLAGDPAGWRGGGLVFGDRAGGGADWAGVLEGIAVYARALGAGEVAADHRRYRRARELRADPGGTRKPLRLRATLEAVSAIPTLREISPYRQALVVFAYRVDEVLAGDDPGPRVRVAHWAILDGETLPIARARPGAAARLDLEPFTANPQLESHYLADDLGGDAGLPLYYDLGG